MFVDASRSFNFFSDEMLPGCIFDVLSTDGVRSCAMTLCSSLMGRASSSSVFILSPCVLLDCLFSSAAFSAKGELEGGGEGQGGTGMGVGVGMDVGMGESALAVTALVRTK